MNGTNRIVILLGILYLEGTVGTSGAFADELNLTINRVTGATAISNSSGSSVVFDNYTLKSSAGLLNPATWTSLQQSGIAGAGWDKANPRSVELAELNIQHAYSFATGSSLSLGNAVTPIPLFAAEDITFDFTQADQSAGVTHVNYVGRRNNLILTVNPYTGSATIKNEADVPVSLDNYAIRSSHSGLNPATWTSFQQSGAAGPGWQEANPRNQQLSELRISGASSLASGSTVSIGVPYIAGGYRDLVLEFTPTGSEVLAHGFVDYAGFPTQGQEVRLENVTVADLSSQLVAGFDRASSHLLDGSGLSVSNSTHSIAPEGNMWLTAGNGFGGGVDGDPFLVFDLGGSQDLTRMRIWNYNETFPGRPELVGRGVSDFEVLTSQSISGPFASLGTFHLDVAPGTADTDFSQEFSLSGVDDVQFVKFAIKSNYNGDTYPTAATPPDFAFVGLSEVQFFALAGGQLGDLNGDGAVNNLDIFPFSLALTDPAAFAAQFPNVNANAVGDINQNGSFNNLDISPFVTLLTAPATVPEPASQSLLLLGGIVLATWRFGRRHRPAGRIAAGRWPSCR